MNALEFTGRSVGLNSACSAVHALIWLVDKGSQLKPTHSTSEISKESVSNIWSILAYTSHKESPSVAQSGLAPELSSVKTLQML